MQLGRTQLALIAVVAHAGVAGCIDLSNPFRPVDNGDLTVTGVVDQSTIRESESIALSATATGGTEPYVFRWSQNAGPEDVPPSESLGDSVSAGPFATAGRYVYRVVVTDTDGHTANDFVTVEVAAAVRVSLSVDTDEILEGSSVGFSTDVTQGSEPFTYAWLLTDGPIELDLSSDTADTLRTPPLTVEGEYFFEVVVIDGDGFSGTDELAVTVSPFFAIETPPILIAGEPGLLSATVEGGAVIDSYQWTVTQGSADFDDASAESPNLTAMIGETLLVELTVGFTNDANQAAQVSHEGEIVAADSARPRVLIETNFGDITFELNADAAPITSANFLAYVDDGFYEGVAFHRNACTQNSDTGNCDPFVLQGGGYFREGDELILKEPPRDPIASEAGNGLSNGDLYTVAMALSGGNAESAQTQFFINLADNAFLDDQDFTVFATVVEGRDVVDAIAAMERTESVIIPGEVSLPVEDVIMERAVRVSP